MFENPLALSGAYQPEIHSRIQIDMPREDRDFFVSIRPTKNTMQTLINILLVKLQTQLKQHGITTVIQQKEFCEYVTNCRIKDGRTAGTNTDNATIATISNGSPVARALSKTSASNDGRGETKTLSKNKKLKK
jgi:hypothetical protein